MGKFELVQSPHDNLLQYQKTAKSIFKKQLLSSSFTARINTFTSRTQDIRVSPLPVNIGSPVVSNLLSQSKNTANLLYKLSRFRLRE